MKVFIIDLRYCNGCYNCQIACKDEHVGNDWTPYAKPQPETGHFWCKVEYVERGTFPKVKVAYIPKLCMHCDNPPCLPVCDVKAIYKRNDGLVIIDPTKCNGCKKCINACPYGAIYFNEDLKIAQKCTGCAHLVDGKGPSDLKTPRCADACPTEVIKFCEEDDVRDIIARAEVLHPEYNTKPRVYYIGLPKRFITGSIYDPEEDECIEDALVTLTDMVTGEKYSVKTDIFGDFWFENLKINHPYSIKIEKEGYYPVEIQNIVTVKDVNLGDIKMFKIKAQPISTST